ncbi:MAG TPA: phosphate/phosphite/phosphonate ABC transporter substrate-binding protein [Gemmata sp.]|jgi:phosphonate transport system substrate-binding protein|nr:phosphate/phosphite/phosphonate ABC transporter substrate-binding protein [Gemmata sp.]
MTEPTPGPVSAPDTTTSNWNFTLGLVAVLIALAGGVYAFFHYTNQPPPPVDELAILNTYTESIAKTQKLADGYVDAYGDMVATPPTDPTRFLMVEEIGFSVVALEDPEKAQVQWKDFMTALERGTGKKVKYVADLSTIDDQVRAVREGRLHVTAFNTGQVPNAVNTAGFVPLFCIADKDGKYGLEMEILVRQDSPVTRPEDLRSKTIGLTALSSNSGGKAPLVILKNKYGMLPGRDYKFTFTGDHVRAVRELVAGQHDAVCVANDQLARAIGAGVIKREQVRSIYKSESFPPLCFGVPHNLPPDLVAKVKQIFTGFSFDGTSVGELYKAQGKTRFAPVDYARDWKLIREVDEALIHLMDSK